MYMVAFDVGFCNFLYSPSLYREQGLFFIAKYQHNNNYRCAKCYNNTQIDHHLSVLATLILPLLPCFQHSITPRPNCVVCNHIVIKT